jgi:hypothetical protein
MIARQPDTGHFIDAEGVTFPCEVVTDAYAALPSIRYEALVQNHPGAAVSDLPVKSALSLLKELQQRSEQGAPEVRVIHIEKPWSQAALLADNSRILFGTDDLGEQLARLDRIWLEARHREWKIDTLNLLVRKNMPITFREPPNLQGLQDPMTASVTPATSTSVR